MTGPEHVADQRAFSVLYNFLKNIFSHLGTVLPAQEKTCYFSKLFNGAAQILPFT